MEAAFNVPKQVSDPHLATLFSFESEVITGLKGGLVFGVPAHEGFQCLGRTPPRFPDDLAGSPASLFCV